MKKNCDFKVLILSNQQKIKHWSEHHMGFKLFIKNQLFKFK